MTPAENHINEARYVIFKFLDIQEEYVKRLKELEVEFNGTNLLTNNAFKLIEFRRGETGYAPTKEEEEKLLTLSKGLYDYFLNLEEVIGKNDYLKKGLERIIEKS